MKKKSLYIAGICAALSVGALGCASSAKAGDEENKTAVEDTKAAGETTAAETSESNTVIEKNAPSGPASGTGKKVHPNLFVFMVRFRRLPVIPSRLTISRESAVPARW